jgi:hypothetical protein
MTRDRNAAESNEARSTKTVAPLSLRSVLSVMSFFPCVYLLLFFLNPKRQLGAV